MRKLIVICAAALMMVGCQSRKQDIYVLYDNDVHCAINGYEQMAAMRDSLLTQSEYVSCVSCGDFVQGSAVGMLSKGNLVVDLMNEVPYDYITLGNHEFDYTIPSLLELGKRMKAQIVCCNFSALNQPRERQDLFPPYAIKKYGRTKVAFLGVATPTTFTSSTPIFFLDEKGEVIYDFHASDLFSLIQTQVDKARKEGADYVIVLSHLGDDTELDNSVDMIEATSGIDVVLDGHQHHVIPARKVANAKGDSVLLSSTGSLFANIGLLTISTDGTISTQLLPTDSISLTSPRMQKRLEWVWNQVDKEAKRVVGHSTFALPDCNEKGERQVRCAETALADVVTDALREAGHADIGVIHGGSLRTALPEGDITMENVIAVLPFNNHLAVVEMTGQQLLDAFEASVRLWPEENGDFHIASGLRYTIARHSVSSVKTDENGLFAGVGEKRRIVSMEVEKDGKWLPIDPQQTYTVAGLDYTLINKGASGMFAGAKVLPCENIKDYEVLVRFLSRYPNALPDIYSSPQGRFIVK